MPTMHGQLFTQDFLIRGVLKPPSYEAALAHDFTDSETRLQGIDAVAGVNASVTISEAQTESEATRHANVYDSTMMRKTVTLTQLKTQSRDWEYWLSRPVTERLAAVEQLRLQAFPLSDSANHAKHQLQRVYRVTQLHASEKCPPTNSPP